MAISCKGQTDTDLRRTTGVPPGGEGATVCEIVTAVGVGIGESAGAQDVGTTCGLPGVEPQIVAVL